LAIDNMGKLNKRQIIIIILTAIAALYGIYEFMSGGLSPKTATTQKSDSSVKDGLMSNLTGDLMKDTLSGVDVYIISKAEADWQRNPFWEKTSYRDWANKDNVKTGEEVAAAKIIYSGYVDSGKKKMAVINGLEYSEGDKLEISGYVLKKITAAKIVLSNKSEKIEKEIPIQE
jgi:hypothetical protein